MRARRLIVIAAGALAAACATTKGTGASMVKADAAASESAMSQCKDLVLGVGEWAGKIEDLLLVQIEGLSSANGPSFNGAGVSVEGVAIGIDGSFALRLICDESGVSMTDRTEEPEQIEATRLAIGELLNTFAAETKTRRVSSQKSAKKKSSFKLSTVIAPPPKRGALAESFDAVLKPIVGTISSSAGEYSTGTSGTK